MQRNGAWVVGSYMDLLGFTLSTVAMARQKGTAGLNKGLNPWEFCMTRSLLLAPAVPVRLPPQSTAASRYL